MARKILDLVLWFKLNGNSNDSATPATNGVWTGTEQYGVGKQYTEAADFVGTNYVSSSASLLVQSVSFWANLDVNNIDLIDLTSSAKISIDSNDDVVTTGLTNVNTYIDNTSSTDLGTGSYKLVILTFDTITADAIKIGDGTDGRIGDVRFYNQSLDLAERTSIYNNGNGNKFNDFTRILYERNGTTQYDVVSDSFIDNNTDEEIDSTNIVVLRPYPISINDAVNYYDYKNDKIYSGVVKDINNKPVGKELIIYNFEVELKERRVYNTYENISPESLIETIVTDFTDLTYIGTLTTGLTIKRYSGKGKRARVIIRDIIERLAGVTYRVDNEKQFNLYKLGSITSATTFINTVNANINSGWNQDTSKQVTSLTLYGETQSPSIEDTFTATAGQTEFTLTEIPKGDVRVTVNGTIQDLEVEGQNDGDYTIDPETKQLVFNSGLSASDNVVINYNYELQINLEQIADTDVINRYGVIDGKITRRFINEMDYARDYALEYLNKYASPILSSEIVKAGNIDIDDLIPGYQVRVVDSVNEVEGENIDGFFIIRNIERRFSGQSVFIKIKVGDIINKPIDFFRESQYNLNQLYEQENNSSITQRSQQLINNIIIRFDSDITNIEKRVFDSDTFYLEDDSAGTRNQMLNSGAGPVMRNISNGNGYVVEDLDNQDRITMTDDTRTTMIDDIRVTMTSEETNLDIGIIPSSIQNTIISNLITELEDNITHIAVGDGSTAVSLSDTTLGNETFREIVFRSNTESSFLSADIKIDTTENNTNTINEIGTFNASSGGTMYTRSLTQSFNKTSTNEFYGQIKINIKTNLTNLDT